LPKSLFIIVYTTVDVSMTSIAGTREALFVLQVSKKRQL